MDKSKTTYAGIVSGKPTRVTFPAEDAEIRLSRFCSTFKADITTFKKQN